MRLGNGNESNGSPDRRWLVAMNKKRSEDLRNEGENRKEDQGRCTEKILSFFSNNPGAIIKDPFVSRIIYSCATRKRVATSHFHRFRAVPYHEFPSNGMREDRASVLDSGPRPRHPVVSSGGGGTSRCLSGTWSRQPIDRKGPSVNNRKSLWRNSPHDSGQVFFPCHHWKDSR